MSMCTWSMSKCSNAHTGQSEFFISVSSLQNLAIFSLVDKLRLLLCLATLNLFTDPIPVSAAYYLRPGYWRPVKPGDFLA